ncbi:MAG: ATP-binding cassette domain-containing protein [Spirochaetaceae bacterium]|nr:ATP-binding cassette domain-containing protein [Spirochaetaceae bacterium]
MRDRTLCAESAIDIEDATVVLGGSPVLESLCLRVDSGESFCVLGPNGSGKSSLVRLIAGELSPLHRSPPAIRIFGMERWDLFALRARLGIVSDALHAAHSRGGTVAEIVLSGFYGSLGLPLRAEPAGERMELARRAAVQMGLEALLDKSALSLSSGELRRALVARALVHDPDLLLLDEPFASLDIAAKAAFASAIDAHAARGRGVALVTHDLSDIPSFVERVVLVKRGSVIADGPKSELLRDEVVSELFGARVEVTRGRGGSFRARVVA